jgi:hypothetical protein
VISCGTGLSEVFASTPLYRRHLRSEYSSASEFRVIAHLLKWKAQSARQSHGWELTVRVQRKDLAKLLSENPSLRPYLKKNLPEAYERAMVEAMTETGLPESDFPSTCPFALDVLLDLDFLP